ncbi:MAG: hypothetical protein LUE20_00005, partial [Oscillospiraceae bacterium]|nr:hypothetical protein [Oscillospiraceae bacterium]
DFRKELDTMCNLSQGVYEQGEMAKARKMAISMHEDGMKEDMIAKYANVDIELVRKWIGTILT